MGQVALALLVLSAAGLIARSLIKLERAELSFEPSRLLIGELALRYDQFDDPTKQLALLERLLPRLEAIPGVRAVSPVVTVPFSGIGGLFGQPAAEGQSAEEAAANPMLNMEVVTPSLLRRRSAFRCSGGGASRTRIARARPPSSIVSQSAARHYWPGDDPIGKRLAWERSRSGR